MYTMKKVHIAHAPKFNIKTNKRSNLLRQNFAGYDTRCQDSHVYPFNNTTPFAISKSKFQVKIRMEQIGLYSD